MSADRSHRRSQRPKASARIAVGLAVLVVSAGIVLAGMILFAGELAPGGQQGSLIIMGLWFMLVVVVGFLIQRRVRFLRWPLAVGVVGPIIAVTGFLAYTNFTDRVVDEDVAVVGETAQETNPPDDSAEADPSDSAGGDRADGPAADAPEPMPDAPVNTEIGRGTFAQLGDYDTTGTATTIDLASGGRVLTLTDFETSNGPDLFVYLVSGEVNSNGDGDGFVDLGRLKGNIGNQQYDIPAGVDLTEFDSVVIWCRAFSAGFGVAELSPAASANSTQAGAGPSAAFAPRVRPIRTRGSRR